MKTIVVWGRVIRYEEGKNAEIFTLVISHTMEENWSKNSSANQDVIEITEEELMDVLDYKNISKDFNEQKEIENIFRY